MSCNGIPVTEKKTSFLYVRAGMPIRFIESENMCDIGSSLDLGLHVAQEGGRVTRTPKHRDKLEFGEVCEGRRRFGSIVVIPCEVGSGRVPIGIVLRIFFTWYISKASLGRYKWALAVDDSRRQDCQRS